MYNKMITSPRRKTTAKRNTSPRRKTTPKRNTNFIDEFFKELQDNFLNRQKVDPMDAVFILGTYGPGTLSYYGEKVFFDKEGIKEIVKLNKGEGKEKLGVCTVKRFEKFLEDYKKILTKNYNKIKKFCDKRGTECYIHSSRDPQLKLDSNYNDYVYKNYPPSGFHPKGLWYSCSTSWLDFQYYKLKNIDNDIEYYKKNVTVFFLGEKFIMDFRWFPNYVYSLDLSDLNIKKINNCKELQEFSKENNKSGMFITNYNISLKKVQKKYDGLEICPYLGLKCNSFYRKLYGDLVDEDTIRGIGKNPVNSEFQDYAMLEAFAKKGGADITSNDKRILWTVHWDSASGVVLKNQDKVKSKRII